MAKQGTILVVDDNKGILTAVQMLLGTCFEKVITISTPNKIKTRCTTRTWMSYCST